MMFKRTLLLMLGLSACVSAHQGKSNNHNNVEIVEASATTFLFPFDAVSTSGGVSPTDKVLPIDHSTIDEATNHEFSIEKPFVLEDSTIESRSVVEDSTIESRFVVEGSTIESSFIVEDSTIESRFIVEDSTIESRFIVEDSTIESPSIIDHSIVDGPSFKILNLVSIKEAPMCFDPSYNFQDKHHLTKHHDGELGMAHIDPPPSLIEPAIIMPNQSNVCSLDQQAIIPSTQFNDHTFIKQIFLQDSSMVCNEDDNYNDAINQHAFSSFERLESTSPQADDTSMTPFSSPVVHDTTSQFHAHAPTQPSDVQSSSFFDHSLCMQDDSLMICLVDDGTQVDGKSTNTHMDQNSLDALLEIDSSSKSRNHGNGTSDDNKNLEVGTSDPFPMEESFVQHLSSVSDCSLSLTKCPIPNGNQSITKHSCSNHCSSMNSSRLEHCYSMEPLLHLMQVSPVMRTFNKPSSQRIQIDLGYTHPPPFSDDLLEFLAHAYANSSWISRSHPLGIDRDISNKYNPPATFTLTIGRPASTPRSSFIKSGQGKLRTVPLDVPLHNASSPTPAPAPGSLCDAVPHNCPSILNWCYAIGRACVAVIALVLIVDFSICLDMGIHYQDYHNYYKIHKDKYTPAELKKKCFWTCQSMWVWRARLIFTNVVIPALFLGVVGIVILFLGVDDVRTCWNCVTLEPLSDGIISWSNNCDALNFQGNATFDRNQSIDVGFIEETICPVHPPPFEGLFGFTPIQSLTPSPPPVPTPTPTSMPTSVPNLTNTTETPTWNPIRDHKEENVNSNLLFAPVDKGIPGHHPAPAQALTRANTTIVTSPSAAPSPARMPHRPPQAKTTPASFPNVTGSPFPPNTSPNQCDSMGSMHQTISQMFEYPFYSIRESPQTSSLPPSLPPSHINKSDTQKQSDSKEFINETIIQVPQNLPPWECLDCFTSVPSLTASSAPTPSPAPEPSPLSTNHELIVTSCLKPTSDLAESLRECRTEPRPRQPEHTNPSALTYSSISTLVLLCPPFGPQIIALVNLYLLYQVWNAWFERISRRIAAALRIQRTFRTFRAIKNYRSRRAAALKIQRVFRGFRVMKHYRSQRAATLKIQRVFLKFVVQEALLTQPRPKDASFINLRGFRYLPAVHS